MKIISPQFSPFLQNFENMNLSEAKECTKIFSHSRQNKDTTIGAQETQITFLNNVEILHYE